MNKVSIVSLIMLASITFVGAEQEGGVMKKELMRAVPVAGRMINATSGQVKGNLPVIRTTEGKMVVGKQQVMSPQNGGGVTGQNGVVKMMLPVDQMTTGDPAIDAQLKSLMTEKNAKIKAIEEEYMTKVKALMEGRTLTRPSAPVRAASSTDMRERMDKEMKIKEMQQGREGGRVEGVASGTEPQRMPVRANAPVNNGAKPVEVRGVGAQFNSLFRGLFGGN